MKRNLVVSALVVLAASCGGDGATGAAGSSGAPGPQGPTGPPGPLPAGYLSVVDFGAKSGVPSFDNTASFQHALDSAAHAGGGTVWVPVGRFFFAGNLSIPANVALAGDGVGPYDPYLDPATNTVAPTLLPTATTGLSFISIDGENSALQDLLIRYPNQVAPDAPGVESTGPKVYPPTIRALFPSKIYRLSLDNSYIGIGALRGRIYLENLQICAFRNDIIIDNALDFVHLSHITISTYGWDRGYPTFPSPIDNWVAANGVALTSYRMDALSVDDFDVFWRNTGIIFLDSPDGLGATYGAGTNVDLDDVVHGVIAKSLNSPGFEFSNLIVGGNNGIHPGVNMIWLQAGGLQAPRIVVEGGTTYSTWSQPLKVDAGVLLERDLVGLNPIGALPALGLVAPTLPASGVAYVSNLPTVARVSISGGTVQDVQIGGKSTGLTSGQFTLLPGESISVLYSSAPSWGWVLE